MSVMFWASLVAQIVKNPLPIQEIKVRSLGQGSLEKGMSTHSSILARRITGAGKPGGGTVHGVTENCT